MSRELLPATFPTKEKAEGWAQSLTHKSIIQSETRVVPSREKPGRFQISIKRRILPTGPDADLI